MSNRSPNSLKLSLSTHRITDAGLSYLKRMTSLSTLDLRGTQISDAGLGHVKGHDRLSELLDLVERGSPTLASRISRG